MLRNTRPICSGLGGRFETESVAGLDRNTQQYLFRRWEIFLSQTNELEPSQITIEHIAPQSKTNLGNCVSAIGNLLPLGGTINNLAQAKDFQSKIDLYKQSKLSIVADFVKKYQGQKEWLEDDINNRTLAIADLAFTKIWKF